MNNPCNGCLEDKLGLCEVCVNKILYNDHIAEVGKKIAERMARAKEELNAKTDKVQET